MKKSCLGIPFVKRIHHEHIYMWCASFELWLDGTAGESSEGTCANCFLDHFDLSIWIYTSVIAKHVYILVSDCIYIIVHQDIYVQHTWVANSGADVNANNDPKMQ